MRVLLLSIITTVFLLGCLTEQELEVNTEDIEKEITEVFHEFYETYANGTSDFYQFYEPDYVNVNMKGEITRGVDDKIKGWDELLESYEVVLREYSDPTLVVGSDQVVTINSYDELFIEKATNDTSVNKGVYIATWRKQVNGSWKVAMETWHAGLD